MKQHARTIMCHDTKLAADWLCFDTDQLASFKRDQATGGSNRAGWQETGGSPSSPRGRPASAGPRGRPSRGSPSWSSHWHRSRPKPAHPRPVQRELESDLSRFVRLCFCSTPGSVIPWVLSTQQAIAVFASTLNTCRSGYAPSSGV